MTGASASRGRAISDLVGFAVVFGIVALSVTLVYTFGLGALTDAQNDEAFDNAGRAFDIIADNVADVHRNGAPSRSTEVDFGEGDLSLAGRVNITVEYGTDNETALVTPLRYRSGDQRLHYAGGAVVRSNRDAATIVREPPFRFGDDRTVLSLVATSRAGEVSSLSGGSARVTSRRTAPSVVSVVSRDTGDVSYDVIVTSPRFRAWERYLVGEGLTCSTDPAAERVTCSGTTETLYLRQTPIDLSLTP